MKVVIRKSGKQTKATIFKIYHQFLAFADDLTIMAKSKNELKKIATKLEDKVNKYGLEIN